MTPLEEDARAYLSRELGGMDMSQVPWESVKACVAKAYDGGWEAYEADFHRFMAQPSHVPAELTPIQLWAKARRIINDGRHQAWMLRAHEEVQSVSITETEIKAVLRIAKVEERAQRERITEGLRLIVWKHTTTGWSAPETIEVFGDDVQEFVRWGRVRTPEWVESQQEQYEECYRPGTKKSPLQGPAARLGVSRNEFHNLPKGA